MITSLLWTWHKDKSGTVLYCTCYNGKEAEYSETSTTSNGVLTGGGEILTVAWMEPQEEGNRPSERVVSGDKHRSTQAPHQVTNSSQ